MSTAIQSNFLFIGAQTPADPCRETSLAHRAALSLHALYGFNFESCRRLG
jgi:hypothetical protein